MSLTDSLRHLVVTSDFLPDMRQCQAVLRLFWSMCVCILVCLLTSFLYVTLEANN